MAALLILDDFLDVLAAVEAQGVRYVIVGSGASVLHGIVREIEDLDFVVDPAPAECDRAARALMQAGFFPSLLLSLTETVVMRFADENGRRVDVHVRHQMSFEELSKRSQRIERGRVTISVVALDDLIEIKKRRRQDDPDVGPLEALRGVR